jgi:hypothetical protein
MALFQLSYLLLWALAILLVPVAVILLYLLAQLERLHRREGVGDGNKLIGRKFPAFSAMAAEGIPLFHLRINDDPLSVFGGDVYRSAVTVGLAGLVVALSGWCLALPKFYRAVHSSDPEELLRECSNPRCVALRFQPR